MSKLRKLSVASFKGDKGWKVRDTYTDLVKEIERYIFSVRSLILQCVSSSIFDIFFTTLFHPSFSLIPSHSSFFLHFQS